MLTPADHARIEAAVAEAEAGSSGDIFCVLAGEVSSYRDVPLAWGAAAALLIPPVALALGLRPLIDAGSGGWTAAHVGASEPQLAMALAAYAIAQIALFAVVTLLASWSPIRRALTPRFLKRRRVRKAALHHFLAAGSHAAEGRTGVVMFIALADRQVEILADEATHAAAGEPVWRAAAVAVSEGMKTPDPTAGIVRGIAICGEALKAHVPSDRPRTGRDRPLEV